MEYENLHSQRHQLEEQVNVIGQSASSLPIIAPSTVTSSGNYTWNQSISILNNGSDLYSSETIPNSRFFPSQATNFMTPQDLTYSFDQASSLMNRQSNGRELSPAKEETSESFSKLRINLPFEVNKSNLLSSLYKQDSHVIGLTNTNSPYSASEPFYFSSQDKFTNFGHVYPNFSYTTSTTSSSSSIMLTSHEGFNSSSQALDLLSLPTTNNYRSAQSCSHSSQNSSGVGLHRECNMSLGNGDIDNINNQEYSRSSPSSNPTMKSGFLNEATTTRLKRRSPSNLSEPNKDQSHKNAEAKKSKSILRSSNPPLKVRKEKLGDRISALHRLVAPFGKTDTASVLTEAIGYIHFLHDQVQTLSMPYMKSLQGKFTRKTQQVHGFGKDAEKEEKILDLRSRGLCLVPVSCASYINNGFD